MYYPLDTLTGFSSGATAAMKRGFLSLKYLMLSSWLEYIILESSTFNLAGSSASRLYLSDMSMVWS